MKTALLMAFIIGATVSSMAAPWTFIDPQVSGDFSDIQMITETSGYITGNDATHGLLLRTSDAGLTWELTMINEFQIYTLSVSPDGGMYIGGRDLSCGCAAIFYSLDGGYSWQNNAPATFENLEYIQSIDALELGKAIAVSSNGVVISTFNAFHSSQQTQLDYEFLNHVTFTDNDSRYMVAGESASTCHILLKSNQGNWANQFDFGIGAHIGGFEIQADGDIILTLNEGSFPHLRHHILKSENEGLSFDTLATLPESIGNLKDVRFPQAQKGYTFSEFGYVYLTTNGGITWTSQNEQIPMSIVNDVQMVSPTFGFAVGNNSEIARIGSPNSTLEKNLQPTIKYGPNPSSDFLTIVIQHDNQQPVALLDLLGKQVWLAQQKIKPNQAFNIDLRDLNAGIYFLKLKDQSSIKIIKNG